MSDVNPGFFVGPQAAGNYPIGATPINASSANMANANAVATLLGVANRVTYIVGFAMTASGATGALVVNPTVAGLIGINQTYVFVFPAGITTVAQPLVVFFGFPGIPATPVGGNITVTLPAGGTGNTNATAVAWGYLI